VTGLAAALVFLAAFVAVLLLRRDRLAGEAGADPPIVDMPNRNAEGVSGVIDGKFYVTTATVGVSDTWLKSLHVYDPKAGSWKQLANSATPHNGAAGGVIGGKLYVAGGLGLVDGQMRPCGTLEVYDPKQDVWTTRKPMPTAREGCAAAVLNGKLYVLGGHAGTNILSTVESYDPVTDEWADEPPMPTPRGTPGAAVVNGTIYVVGGSTDGYEYAVSVDRWKPGGPWATEVTSVPMPVPAAGIFAAAAGDAIYVAGGSTPRGAVDFLRAYLPDRHWWTTNEAMPEARYQGSGAQVFGGKLYLFGGWSDLPASGNLPARDVFVYDLLKNRWRRSVPAASELRNTQAPGH
jgi:N-acetylneuraminic acid mutarotase